MTTGASVDSNQTVSRGAWDSRSLRLELVADQAVYTHKGIDHALYPEPDSQKQRLLTVNHTPHC
jgi:hypothetical protein